jgi:RND family efflux transporter MFP subunit
MKKYLVPGVLLFGIITLHGCSQPEAGQPEDAAAKIYPVKVQAIQKENITRTLDLTANLKAFEVVHLAPASPGKIDRILVDIADRVKRGETVVEMDRTQLQQSRIQMENARSNFLRLDTLYRLGSTSEQQYEQVRTQYDVAKSNVEFLEENTTLEAPISGIVTGRYFEPEEMYTGTPNTPEGKPAVVSIMRINPLKAYINISERYYPEITGNMQARVKLDMYPGEAFSGRIYRVHPTVDETTRTFKAEVLVDNAGEKLRPGMFARVMLELEDDRAILVPAISVLQQEGTNNRYVFINSNETARRINVSMGKRYDDRVEITSDRLKEGMQVVVAGQANLDEGARVKVVE